jgi:phosphomethylpyrimidine synthase
MKITQEVRDYAAAQGLSEDAALEQGLQAKSEEFRKAGGEIYIPIHPSAAASEQA